MTAEEIQLALAIGLRLLIVREWELFGMIFAIVGHDGTFRLGWDRRGSAGGSGLTGLRR